MKFVVAEVSPTPILWLRASGLESPTEVPASALPARRIAPVRANIASRSVVLPLWKGPTSAMHRGPRGLLTSCPIAASLCGARPLIGSAKWMLTPDQGFGKREKRHDTLHVFSLQCILRENGVLSSTSSALQGTPTTMPSASRSASGSRRRPLIHARKRDRRPLNDTGKGFLSVLAAIRGFPAR